ncbi:MAG: Crp/Fnr family transcriptional regulator [Blastocatellia bacterium]
MQKINPSSGFALSELESINLFRNVPETELRQLGEWLHRKTFSTGTILMTADQAGESVYFIFSGTVKVHVEQADGSDVIISILGPGECFGEMSALDRPSRSASVTTLESTDLCWLDRATFRKFLATIPMLGHNLSCLLSARLRLANEQIQALSKLDVECRVARQLIGFADKYGQPASGGDISIPVRLTQSDLANLIGATRESVNKIIVSYKERGYLSASRDHRWTIHNRQFLANRCGA